jgi:S1-C subfamily serine protease
MIVGRSRSSDLRIDDDSVSGTHARLEIREGKSWIVDLNSTNGVFINGRKVRESSVGAGDTVRIGSVDLHFDGENLVPSSGVSKTAPATPNIGSDGRLRAALLQPKLVGGIAAVGLLVLAGAVLFRGEDRSTLDLARATVLVVVLDDKDEPCGFGSGFVVRDNTTIATNYHVIESVVKNVLGEEACKTVAVGISDGTGLRVGNFTPARVIASDPSADVAILEIDPVNDWDVQPLEIEGSDPKLGDAIRILGYPAVGGISLTVTTGSLGGLDESESRPFYKTTAQIAGGNSGGPVVNERGKVIGLATAAFVDSEEVERIGLIIPSQYVSQLLEKN